MSETILRELVVKFKGDSGALGESMKAAMNGLSSFASGAVSSLGPVGIAIGTLTAGIAAIGGLAFDVAEKYDEAFDSIRVATGKVGPQLAGLQNDFRAVITSIPATTKEVAEAIGFIASRLQIHGKELQELAKNEIELARLTHSDLKAQMEQTTRLFKDFDVKDPKEALDFLFRAAQQTGTKITEVAQSLVAYGAPLRGLGFSFESAAALVTKFKAEGVELEKALPGMRIALAKMASEGVANAGEAFKTLIENIKNAGSTAEAQQKAIETFGRRAGPDMAEAIRQGRFSIGELEESLRNGSETIEKAVKATDDYGEAWHTLKNKISDLIQPLGEVLRGVLNGGIEALSSFVEAYEGDWNGLKTTVGGLIADLGKLYKDHEGEIKALAEVTGVVLKEFAKFWAENIADTINVIRVLIKFMNEDYRGALELMAKMDQDELEKDKAKWQGWRDFLGSMLKKWIEQWTGDWKSLGPVLQAIWNEIKTALGVTWDSIKVQADNAWKAIGDAIAGPIKRTWDWLNSLDWKTAFERITDAAKIGLQVHSPPIAAVWVEQIGVSAGSSAKATLAAAPGFGQAMSEISGFAKEHLPKTVALFVDMGASVLKVLSDLKIKVPKALEDIFGGASSSSKSKQSAKAIDEAWKNASVGVQTSLTAATSAFATFNSAMQVTQQTGSKTAGIVSSLFSSTIAGIQAGMAFGPVGGAIVGGVSLIGGILGSIFGGKSALQKAQEAAALQQAKDAVKKSQEEVLQLVEKTKQSWLDTLDKARSLLESISFYTKVPKDSFKAFFTDVGKLFAQVVPLAQAWKLQATEDVSKAAENLKSGVELVSALPGALDAIGKYLGTSDLSFTLFFAAVAKFFLLLDDLFQSIPKATAKYTSKWAGWLKDAVDLIAPLTEGLAGLLAIKQVPTDENYAIWKKAIELIVQNISDLSGLFEKSLMKQMAFFAEKAAAALELWKNATDAIRATVDVPTVTAQDAQTIVASIRLFLETLIAGLQSMPTEELTRVTAIAANITPIAAAIKAWADAAAAIRGYTLIASETWGIVLDDFRRGLTLIRLMLLDAEEYVTDSEKLKDLINEGSTNISDALSQYVGSIQSMASILSGGLPQGGIPAAGASFPGAAASSSFGPLSLASSGLGGSAAGGVVVNLHVAGSLIHQNQVNEMVLTAIVEAQRRGRMAA